MLLSQFQTSPPWISRVPRLNHIPPHCLKRRSTPFHVWWIESSTMHAQNFRMHCGGKWQGNSPKLWNKLNCTASMNVSNGSNHKVLKMRQNSSSQDYEAKPTIGCISAYCTLRLIQLNFVATLIKMVQESFSSFVLGFGSTSSAFACISNTMGKPKPLGLDVSFPSFHDLRWSFARLLYLFNIQLERNVATFFIVLLAACFSFVVIGGLLFFKFRDSTQSLEDCLWEAWACLCSSSTHLRKHIACGTAAKNTRRTCYWPCSCHMGHPVLL